MSRRLFVGVPVTPEIRERVAQLQERLRGTGAHLLLVSPENLHFTVSFLGERLETEIPGMVQAVAAVVKKYRSFSLRLQEVGVFPSLERIKVVWIGTADDALLPLMQEAEQALGIAREPDREEKAHLTIARVKSGKNKPQLQAFIAEVQNEEFGEMPVDQLILYASHLTPEGPIYTVVREFPLGR